MVKRGQKSKGPVKYFEWTVCGFREASAEARLETHKPISRPGAQAYENSLWDARQ